MQYLYHVTRKRNSENIKIIGLIPKKPCEWRLIIPPRWRNKEIVWLQGKALPRSRRWLVRLRVDVSQLNPKHLHRLHKLNREEGLEWWFYAGIIPSGAIS